jgi:hypothetical protein
MLIHITSSSKGIFARNVQSLICHKIGNARFCLFIDKAQDESRR